MLLQRRAERRAGYVSTRWKREKRKMRKTKNFPVRVPVELGKFRSCWAGRCLLGGIRFLPVKRVI